MLKPFASTCLLTALLVAGPAASAAWTPGVFINASGNAWNLYWPHAEWGGLAVAYTGADGQAEPEFIIAEDEEINLEVQPGETLAIRMLNEAEGVEQSFSLMDPSLNVVSRLTLASQEEGQAVLGWENEPQDGPHPGAPLFQILLPDAAHLAVQTPPAPEHPGVLEDPEEDAEADDAMNVLPDGPIGSAGPAA